MPKTIASMIHDAELKQQLWTEVADDPQALTDRDKTREEALQLANYFEGKFEGLVEGKRLYKPENLSAKTVAHHV